MDSSLVYLIQTDTTVGFSSSSEEKLALKKQRALEKKSLQTINSFKTLKEQTRIPKKYKKLVRKAKKTTFIYPNKKSFRLINKKYYFYDFIHKFTCLYSSSANLTAHNYNEEFAQKVADVIVENNNSFSENKPSSIIKLYKNNKIKIR